MSGSVTLSSLRSAAKDRADLANSTRVSTAQWNEYINKSKDNLYDLLVAAYGNDYYMKIPPYDLTIVAGTDTYSLPTDHYKTALVEYKMGTDNYYTLKKFALSTKNRFPAPLPLRGSYDQFRYKEMDDKIIFYPTPSSGCTVRIWYVPLATNLVSDSDTIRGFNGWEEYIIIDVAIKALRNEESDTIDLERDLKRVSDRLIEMAETRNLSEPFKIQDTNPRSGVYDYEYYEGLY